MKAILLKGKKRGKVVRVMQWCNDWFHVEDIKGIYSPNSLGFSASDKDLITSHKNNGMLFALYEWTITKPLNPEFPYTFKKRNFRVEKFRA